MMGFNSGYFTAGWTRNAPLARRSVRRLVVVCGLWSVVLWKSVSVGMVWVDTCKDECIAIFLRCIYWI